MNINEFIKDLSIKDKKTLSQKALKVAEEVGELARAILPYDSAHGTNHRFTNKEQILEEVIDVYLTSISIAHSIGITDDEFNDMLSRKTTKWAELQSKEENAKFPLPFEIHISVDVKVARDHNNRDATFNMSYFRETCVEIGVKPIMLDLEINGKLPIKDVMTSSKHFGDNRTAYEESERISNELTKLGYNVLRKKIETVPWHPAAPVELISDDLDFETDEVIPNDCYFESHIGVVISPEQKDELIELTKEIEIYLGSGRVKLSQNFFKKSKNGEKFINMLTYRNNKVGGDRFKKDVESIKRILTEQKFNYEKVEVEYAIYDTNVTHDIKWIKG